MKDDQQYIGAQMYLQYQMKLIWIIISTVMVNTGLHAQQPFPDFVM